MRNDMTTIYLDAPPAYPSIFCHIEQPSCFYNARFNCVAHHLTYAYAAPRCIVGNTTFTLDGNFTCTRFLEVG